MKIVFMGTPSYATSILEALLEDNFFDVLALFTQPDKPVGRKQILTPPHTKKIVNEKYANLKIYQPITLKNKNIQEEIKNLNPDFIIVAAFGQILPKEVLQICPCINLHASLLPLHRGASPIQSSILSGDLITGVTAMLMDEGLDTGDMLSFSYIKIKNDIKFSELFVGLASLAAKLCTKTLKDFNSIKPLHQNHCQASYAPKISRKDSVVSFDESAIEIYKKFNAFYPWPGINLENGLKLTDIKLLDGKKKNLKNGEILQIKNNFIEIACGVGSLAIFSLQPPSKKDMISCSYIQGKRIKVGDILY